MNKCYRLLGLFIVLLGITLATIDRSNAQCNTAPVAGPINLTLNMSGPSAIIDNAVVGAVLTAVDGGAPCTNCDLYYSLTSGGPYVRLQTNNLTVNCLSQSFPFSMYFIARRPGMGNPCPSAEIELIVSLNDQSPPTIVCPPTQTVSADGSCTAVVPGLSFTNVSPANAMNPLEYGDNCVQPALTYVYSGATSGMGSGADLSGIVFELGVTTITMTADDGTSTTSCNFNVDVQDNTPPTWVPENTTPAFWYTLIGVPTTSDAIVSMTYGGPGSNRFTVTLDCDSDDYNTVYNYFATSYEPTAQDNCDPDPEVLFNNQSNVLPWVCPTASHIRRRWRARDAAGNEIQSVPPGPTQPLAKLDLIVTNTQAPVFTTAPVDVTIAANDPMTCGLDITGTTFLEVEATADCQGDPDYAWVITSAPLAFGGAMMGVGNNAEQFYVPGSYNITYTATDGCGNATAHSFTFELIDVVPPTVTCPPSQTLSAVLDNCFQNAIWDEATYMDNCPGPLTLSVAGADPNGNNINILTFQGAGGCSDQPGFDGDFAPVNWGVSGPGNVNWMGAPMTLSITNTNVIGTTTVSAPLLNNGVILFGWDYSTALLSADNEFGYSVNGTQYPLVVNGQLVLGSASGTVLTAVNVGDIFGFYLIEDGTLNNDPSVEITNFIFLCGSGNNVSFASFPVGSSTITYTVSDAALNTTTCDFTITVTDDQDPIITCGGDQTIFTVCPTTSIPNYTANVAAIDENCPGYTISQSPAAGTTLGAIFAPGVPADGSTFMVTLTITDKGGNTDDCTFMVTLDDQDLPVPDVDPLPPVNPATTLGTDCGTYIICAPTATKCNGDVVFGTTSLAGAVFDPNACGMGQPGYTIVNPSFNAILWTYDDGLGNIITQTQQVDIFVDATPPTLNCPPDITVNTDPGVCTTTGIAGIDMTEIFPTTPPYLQPVDAPNDGEMIDNCGIVMIGWTSTTGSAANTNNAGTGTYQKGDNIITYTASDAAGNTSSCAFTITVQDNEPPTFTCPAGPIVLFTGSAGDAINGDCAYTLGGMDTSLDPSSVMDNCPGPISVTHSISPLTAGASSNAPSPNSLAGVTFNVDPSTPASMFLVSWDVVDIEGNAAACSYVVMVVDGEDPVITCPSSPQSRTTSQDGNPGDCFYEASSMEFDPVSTSDNCDVATVFNDFNLGNSLDGEFFPTGSTIITWTVVDNALNVSTCSFEVVVTDDEPPVNTYCPTSVTLPNIAGDCNNFVAWERPQQNDWTDNCDPSASLTVTEVVSDPGVQAALNNNSPYNQVPIVNRFVNTIFPVGTTTITYTATDLSGNSDQCIFTVTIEDIDPPTITCPPDVTLGTTCLTGVVPNYINGASIIDNCPSDVTITQSPAPGTSLATVFAPNAPMNGDVFVVTLTATDLNPQGLSSNCTFNVTLEESNNPQPNVAILPSLLDSCSVIDVVAPTADDCGNTIEGVPNTGTLIAVNPAVYRYTTGIYNVIWTYLGASGSTQQGQFIEVQDDTTPPNTLCQPVNVNLSASNPGTVTVFASAFDAGSTDHCGIVSLDYAVNGGSFFPVQNFGCGLVGVHSIELQATDDAGNTGTCITTLTINDVTPPTIVGGCPTSFTIGTSNNGGYDCEALATFLAPNVTDNCAIASYQAEVTPAMGNVSNFNLLLNQTVSVNLPKGVASILLTVVDVNGNSSDCGFTVTVVDDEDPQITCPPNQTRSNNPGLCSYQVLGGELDPVSFADNCPGAFITNSVNGLNTLDNVVFPVGSSNLTWTVFDAVGRSVSCSFTLTVVDDEPPVIFFCQSNIVQAATTGTCNALVSWSPTFGFDVADNCGIQDITQSFSNPNVIPVYPFEPFGPSFPPFLLNQALFPVGVTTVNYTVEDIHGNTSLCSFTVEVLDDQAPVVVCPPDVTLGTTCLTGVVPDYRNAANVIDNCLTANTISQMPAPGTTLAAIFAPNAPANGDQFTVTITATDQNPLNLSGSCSFTVTLEESNTPQPNMAVLPSLLDSCGVIDVVAPTADDCGNTVEGVTNAGILISTNPAVYRFTTGIYNVIWTYFGASNNAQQVQFIDVRNDMTAPNTLCQPVAVNLSPTNPGMVTVTASQFDAGSSDYCGIVSLDISINGGSFVPSAMLGCSEVGVHTVELRALDAENNDGYCTTTLTVNDITDPTIVGGCPADLIISTSNNGGYDCEAFATFTAPQVEDNCAIQNYFAFINPPGGGTITLDLLVNPVVATNLGKGFNTVGLLVIDEHGNNNFCSFSITVVDDEEPQITCPADQIRANDPGLCSYETIGKEFDPISFIDNCPDAFVFNNFNGTSSLEGAVFPVGVTNITWTVVDQAGLFSLCTFTVTVEDTEDPVFTWCQPNISQVSTAGTCNALVSWSPSYGFDVDDNCGIDALMQTISDPSVIPVFPYEPFGPSFPPFLLNQALFPIGVTTVSYTVTDIHGNSAICSFEVEILDEEAPSITCPPNQVLNTICADGNVPDYTGIIANLTDNCVANLIVTQSPTPGTPLGNVPGLTPANGESFTVTITAQDPQPNFLSDACSFTVTLQDVNLPVPNQANLPTLFGPCEGLIVAPPTANDCGNVIFGIPSQGMQISFNPPLYEFSTGLYTVIWTYVGANGSTQQVQQIQVIDDVVPPVMNCMNASVFLDANGNGSLSVAQVDAGISDNCGLDNITVSPSTYNCANVGANIATVTATDIHGNTNTCQVVVSVFDFIAPTFNILNQTLTANCNNVPPIPNVLASDACGLASTNFTEVSTQGGNPALCPFYSYTITRTWEATDVNGNFAAVQQVIIVQDITPPVWTQFMPTDITVGTNPFTCNGNVTLIVDAGMVTDNCAPFANLSISYSGTNVGNGSTNASGLYPLGTTVVVFTATDPCGNVSQHEVNVTVVDTSPPTPVCVNSVTVPLNSMGMVIIPPSVVDNGSFDNCGPVLLSVSPDTFTCADAGQTITVVLTVTDLAGNISTCPAQVNVIDNTPPVLVSCPQDVTITCESSISPASLGEPVFSDSCGVNLTFTDVLVPIGGAICYRIDRNWVANDGFGNITTCVQRISVIDTTPPDFNSDLPLPFVVISCSDPVPAPSTPTAEDNCDPNPVVLFNETSTQSANPLTCEFYDYTITRTYTARDACNNQLVYTEVIVVRDTVFPEFVGMPDSLKFFTNDFNPDSCTVPISLVAVLTDNCQPDSAIIVINSSPFGDGFADASGNYPAGTYNIGFQATDGCGNDVQAIVFIEVVDNSIPVAVCFSNINVSLNSVGQAVLTPAQIDDQSYDNCTAHGDLLFELSQDTFDCSNLGVNIVTLTVTDEAGNFNQCNSVVNVSPGPNNNLTHSTTVTFETFAGANDGAISVVVAGGSGNFTYLWSPGGQTNPNISGLASGTYTLVVTDQVTGCVLTIEVFVGIIGVPDVTISGRIFTPTGLPVALVEVAMTGSLSGLYVTDIDGFYEFTVPAGSTVTITPTKDINPANGVTSLDFAVIQQHILAPPALKPLTTPYKLIAADENGNNQINGIDIAVFQNTILNNLPSFPNVDSWVFVEADYVFPDPLQPWLTGWPAAVTFNLIATDAPDTDFIGVKMGDVTDDVDVTMITGGETAESRQDESLEIRIEDRPLTSGEIVQVVVRAGTFNQLRAYQFDWQFAPQVLSFIGAQAASLQGISSANFSQKGLMDGALPHLWFSGSPVSMAPGEDLYILEFEVLQGGYWLSDVLTLGTGYLGRIAYDQDGTDMAVKLVYEKPAVTDEEGDHFVLIGNRPNPFSFQTLVEFQLPESTPVTLTVTDMQGRALEIVRMDGVAGYNVISLEHTVFPAPGMYLYILETDAHRALGKLIYQQ